MRGPAARRRRGAGLRGGAPDARGDLCDVRILNRRERRRPRRERAVADEGGARFAHELDVVVARAVVHVARMVRRELVLDGRWRLGARPRADLSDVGVSEVGDADLTNEARTLRALQLRPRLCASACA